jgi:hypothetical protein
MPGLVTLIAGVLAIVSQSPSLAQIPAAPAASNIGWSPVHEIKTAKITIEFEYTMPAGSLPSFCRAGLSDEAYGWIPPSASARRSRREQPADRTRFDWDYEPPELLPPPPPCELSLANRDQRKLPLWGGPPATLRLGDCDPGCLPLFVKDSRLDDWLAQTVITSVELIPESGVPVPLPLPLQGKDPGRLRLEFRMPPHPPPPPPLNNTDTPAPPGVFTPGARPLVLPRRDTPAPPGVFNIAIGTQY